MSPLAALLVLGALAAPAQARPLVEVERQPLPTRIEDVHVFDARTGERTGPHDVLLQGGRVYAILEPGTARAGALRVVDGSGGTLLPGLIDLHVHLGGGTMWPGRLRIPSPRANLEAMLYAGVTTVLDLSAPPEHLDRWRDRIGRGRLAGPRILGSGRPFAAPDGHPRSAVLAMSSSPLVRMVTRNMALPATTSEEVDRGMASEGPRDVFKVMLDAIPRGVPEVTDEALHRLRLLSRDMNRPLLAHVGRPDDVERALRHGVDGLAHIPYSGRLTALQAERVADADMVVIPTLAVWEAVEQVASGSPALDAMSTEILGAWALRDIARVREGRASLPEGLAGWAHELVEHRDDRFANVAALHAAGARILVGSDAPNLGLAPGAGTHHELALLREAGLSPAETLMAATWHNSRLLDRNARFGAVLPGWEADLLLVDGDPLTDPEAIHRIRAVWTAGRLVERRPRLQGREAP